MNYDQFIAAVKAMPHDYGRGVREPDVKDQPHYRRSEQASYDDFYLIQSWVSGGTDGGNCWGDGGHFGISADPEPQTWPELEAILEVYWPDISFLAYRKYMLPLFKTDNYTIYEYYGNNTKYTCKVILLKELFDIIKEHGKLPE